MTTTPPEPAPNTDGFYPATEITPYVWTVQSPDGYYHKLRCDFPTFGGNLPCTCHSQKSRQTEWWYYWLQWQRARIYADPTTFPVAWPTTLEIGISGHSEEPDPGPTP